MSLRNIEISRNGKWLTVPALDFDGKQIVTKGSLVRIASVYDEEWLDTELANPDLCVQELKKAASEGLPADLFTFAQKLPATAPKYNYFTEMESIAAVRLPNFKTWWDSLPQETRKNVRRAQKRGVTIEIKPFGDDIIRGLMELNNDSPMRQGKPNKHYGKSFDQVKKDYSAFLDRSDLIGAYSDSELVGLIKIVYRGEVASILQCYSKPTHYDKRPANALLAKAMELCESKGITYVIYGKFAYGNKRESPLLQFKIRNGFEEVLVPRFYIPLTARGQVFMAAKLHRGLVGLLPQRVILAGGQMRAKWYDLLQSKSRCSSMPERPNRNRQMECSNPPAGSNS